MASNPYIRSGHVPDIHAHPTINRSKRYHHVKRNVALYAMVLPGLIYFIIFKIVPMFGISIAFFDYKPYFGLRGFLDSEFVGLRWFERFFRSIYAKRIIGNTLIISLMKLVYGFPIPIIFAIVLSEISAKKYKRTVQTISCIPHFLSWVIVSGLVRQVLTIDGGFANSFITQLGGEPVRFIGNPTYFRWILLISSIWKGTGWDAIIYLAAISAIPSEQYESAKIDGAGLFQRMRYITLPSLLPIISIMLILRVGDLLDGNFEQTQLLLSSQVYKVGDIIDTYVYREGVINLNYSYSTAVNFFKSFVGLILVGGSNAFARKVGQETLW